MFDTHFHIIDFRFPVQENQGFMPPSFPVDAYQERTRDLGITGGCVVSGSFQGFDTACMLDALAQFGPTFVGVIQIPASVSDEEIRRLDAAGVRGVRFNLVRGGSASIEDLDRLARRVYGLAGWHAELYADARDLEPIEATLARPCYPAVVPVRRLRQWTCSTSRLPSGGGCSRSPAGTLVSSQRPQSLGGRTTIERLWYGATSAPGSDVSMV